MYLIGAPTNHRRKPDENPDENHRENWKPPSKTSWKPSWKPPWKPVENPAENHRQKPIENPTENHRENQLKTQLKTTAVYTEKTNSGDLARCQPKENCPTMIQWYLTIWWTPLRESGSVVERREIWERNYGTREKSKVWGKEKWLWLCLWVTMIQWYTSNWRENAARFFISIQIFPLILGLVNFRKLIISSVFINSFQM